MEDYRFINKQSKNTKNKKPILTGIIFARACCSLGIVIFHYFCHSEGKFKLLYATANSGWGFMFVTSFFCISGTVLYYNYPNLSSIKIFYFKRWKSMFPPFYICYIYFYTRFVFRFNNIFYHGHWSRLIFTIFGLDGYLAYRFKTYSIIGEWFLGAIIIIYSLYPLLLWLINNYFIYVQLLLCLYYYFQPRTNFFIISKYRNIFTCINSFYFGMSAIKLKTLFFYNKTIFIISIILLVFLCIIKISSYVLLHQIQGFSLYIILVHVGRYIMLKNINVIFKEMSDLSYYIFLFQHQVIRDILSLYNPVEWYYHLILLGIIIIIIIIYSKILSIIVKSFIRSFIFQKLESLILT